MEEKDVTDRPSTKEEDDPLARVPEGLTRRRRFLRLLELRELRERLREDEDEEDDSAQAAIFQDIDTILARVETDIAAERTAMNALLDRLTGRAA
jgi:hypothetical protein